MGKHNGNKSFRKTKGEYTPSLDPMLIYRPMDQTNTNAHENTNRGERIMNNHGNGRPPRKESVGARLICDALSKHITDFLDNTTEDMETRSKTLFKFAYPFEESFNTNLKGYVVERNVWLDKEDPTKLSRASCSIVYLEDGVDGVRYFATAYINAAGNAAATVYEQDPQRGTIYSTAAKWNNRRKN